MPELADNVEERFDRFASEQRAEADHCIEELRNVLGVCESPVERLFLIEATELLDATPRFWPEPSYRKARLFARIHAPFLERYTILIDPQAEIEVEDSTYRADFLFTIRRADDIRHQTEAASGVTGYHYFKLVIEIDGHDFHDRTKAQAKRDRKRDRAMFKAGFAVWRYTGSEVYHDAREIGHEVRDFLMSQAENIAQEIGS